MVPESSRPHRLESSVYERLGVKTVINAAGTFTEFGGKQLDFVAAHFYPKKGEVEKAIAALAAYELGKPLLIEEMFPLKCSVDELSEFINKSADKVDGWISFYWGATAEELRSKNNATIGEAITASWLEKFREMSEGVKDQREK
jgi:hypothetical protein